MRLYWYERFASGDDLEIQEIENVIRTLKRILTKGGIVVVSENDTLITTYNLDSYDRKLAFK